MLSPCYWEFSPIKLGEKHFHIGADIRPKKTQSENQKRSYTTSSKNSQHFQQPIKQPLEKSGDTILTRCLPTRGKKQPIKKVSRG